MRTWRVFNQLVVWPATHSVAGFTSSDSIRETFEPESKLWLAGWNQFACASLHLSIETSNKEQSNKLKIACKANNWPMSSRLNSRIKLIELILTPEFASQIEQMITQSNQATQTQTSSQDWLWSGNREDHERHSLLFSSMNSRKNSNELNIQVSSWTSTFVWFVEQSANPIICPSSAADISTREALAHKTRLTEARVQVSL